MSNKQIKLYTEEQMRKALRAYFDLGKFMTENDVIKHLTPIELPSDEEIKIWASLTNPYMDETTKSYREGFIKCAKWMRDKIQGGNK